MTMGLSAGDLAGVELAGIVAYLRATGWREADSFARTVVWARAVSEDDTEVLVPDSRQLRGYESSVAELLATLSAVERRPRTEVLRDITSTNLDVQYIRTTPDGPSGTIPLHEGYLAIHGVRDLFLFAATSAVSTDRPAVLPSTKPLEAQGFLDTVRLGQTGSGSYVLRLETPLPQANTTPPLSSRDVLLHLHAAVSAAHNAAVDSVERQDLTHFADRIVDGVSANLCEALTKIGGLRQSEFDMRFAWAPAAPVEEETPAVAFDQGQINALKRGARFLRELPVLQRATVVGQVVDLHRAPQDRLGKVQLEGTVQGQEAALVTMQLPSNWYDLAVVAHGEREHAQLQVVGDLRFTGRQYVVSGVTSVEIIRESR
ncbi:hypothetical protein [Herbihabitans rhizosphaerae]|nr:hypothetical protein [Herbihabitans rhizosphaerae]